jgi:hypothetical protein
VAGPDASVILPGRLTEQQNDELHEWLRSLGKAYHGNDGWLLIVRNYKMLDLDDVGKPSCAFRLNVEPELSMEFFKGTVYEGDEALSRSIDWQQQQLHDLLDFFPEQRITVNAGCQQPMDHRILAQLVIRLAEQYGGVVDLNGWLTPDWKLSADEVRAYLLKLPGRVMEVHGTTGAGKPTIWHLVDPVFLRAWLKEPNFHMIK